MEIRQAAHYGGVTEQGLIVAEGPHLLAELQRSQWPIQTLILTPATFARYENVARALAVETIVAPEKTVSSIASTATTQCVISLARPRSWSWPDLLQGTPLLVVLDVIQDPGNAGTIIRSAEAFGATGVVFLPHSVRITNGKLLRAASGSLFRLPFRENVSVEELVRQSESHPFVLHALSPAEGASLFAVNLRAPAALVVGSEGTGVSPELLLHSHRLSIPTGRVESLNAAIACFLALFEASRQRSQA